MGSRNAVNDTSHPRRRFERARDKKQTRARIQQDLGNEPDSIASYHEAKRERSRRATQKTERLMPVLVSESDADLPVLTESGRAVMIVDGQFDSHPAVASRKPDTVQAKKGKPKPNEVVVRGMRKPNKEVAPLKR